MMALCKGAQTGVLEELTYSVQILTAHLDQYTSHQAAKVEILRSIQEELRGLRVEIREMDERKKREAIPYEPDSGEGSKRRRRLKMMEELGKGKQGKKFMYKGLVDRLEKMTVLLKSSLCDFKFPRR